MLRIVMVAGEPGSGKSTLMRTVFPERGMAFRFGLVRGEMFGSAIARLGIYEPGTVYSGTDRLSMAVQPDALRFVAHAFSQHTTQVIAFEGDRLCNPSLLHALRRLPPPTILDIRVLVLQTAARIVEKRRAERGDTFASAWVRGRQTKVQNFRRAAEGLATVAVRPSNSQADIVSNAEHLSGWIFGE